MQNWILIFFKGAGMGIADLIPGVSGGTVALITGIYERIVTNLGALSFKNFWRTIDWKLFLPLAAGAGSAILLFSNLMHWLLEKFPGQTYALFFGLILVSAWLMIKELKSSRGLGLAMLVGVALAYWFSGLRAIETDHSLITLFLSGMVAIMAMLLPGVSGSFLLLLLGQYEYVLNAVRTFDWPVVLVFWSGCVMGIISFSRLLKYLVSHHRLLTLGFLTGLMIGSLRLPYTVIRAAETEVGAALFFALLGIGLVLGIEGAAAKLIGIRRKNN
jgi:putative membrane protein